MARRALQDITNIRNANIKVVIKKEQPVLRREILKPFLAYLGTFRQHLEDPVIPAPYPQLEEITREMRQTLIEWMYDVKRDLHFPTAAFQVAVRILDVYISKKQEARKNEYQLLGCASLFIAQKLWRSEKYRLSVFVDLCDNAYTSNQILGAERSILNATNFRVNYLLPMHVIQNDHQHLGNSLCTYASEALLLRTEYATQNPKGLAEHIEKQVLALTSGEKVERGFMETLTRSESMLSQQNRCVQDAIQGFFRNNLIQGFIQSNAAQECILGATEAKGS